MKLFANNDLHFRHYPLYAGNPGDAMDHPNKSGDDGFVLGNDVGGVGCFEGSVGW